MVTSNKRKNVESKPKTGRAALAVLAKAAAIAAARVAARAAARRPLRGKASGGANGMNSFVMDVHEPVGRKAFVSLAKERPAFRGFAATSVRDLGSLDPEVVARNYLDQAFASDAVKKFARPMIESAPSDFRIIGTEAVPLTGTKVVRFCQTFNKIPVYGSLVSVELDEHNVCLSINSSLGTPKGVQHIAKVSPAQALAVAAKEAGYPQSKMTTTPRLYFYFDQGAGRWSLAYIIEDVPQRVVKTNKIGRRDAVLKDYVVDAHSGKLLADLPRTPTIAASQETARDGAGRNRKITVDKLAGGRKGMRDTVLNVTTCGFSFKDPSAQSSLLPGTMYESPPSPWPPEAVAAHANGSEVARFLRNVVKRNNIDGKGGEMIFSVNCWDKSEGTTPARQWKNAYWNGDQMVFGQVKFPDSSLYSIANMLDVVGHEMFHGVTDYTSRLEYRTQSGALNESYSDIFGVIVANFQKPLDKWTWEIGVGFDGPGAALRNMKDPTLHDQPKIMKNFRHSRPPYSYDRNDYGWVHDNSGIHNYAAYSVMTTKSGGMYLFSPTDIASMFYIALTVHLTRTSQFSDSRRAMVQAARSLFRNDGAAVRADKVKAVGDGYSKAGIV